MGEHDPLLLQALQSLREEGFRRDTKLDRITERLELVPGLVDDVAEMKPKVDRLEAEGHKRSGAIAIVSMCIGMFGVQAFEWAVSLLGKK